MSEFKVIEENEFGVLVVETNNSIACEFCKHKKLSKSKCLDIFCKNGRYLTEEEEQEYYSSKRA